MMHKGTSYVDMFRYSNDPSLSRIFKERIEPYLEKYPTVSRKRNYTLYSFSPISNCLIPKAQFIPIFLCNFNQNKKEVTELLVSDPSYAVYDNAQATKALQPYLKCQVIDTGVSYYPVTFAYAMPKNSPFFEAFNYHIKHLKEIGAVKRYHDMDRVPDPDCPDYSGQPINQGQCFTAFIILIVGASISITWFG